MMKREAFYEVENMPFFSVIIPVYNVEKYLAQCVDSILSQTFPDFEIIIVDDGSTDSSPAICDAYQIKDARIKVIHKQNGGLVSARKTGIENSTGEYVINVDSDDYIENDLFKQIFSVIEKTSPDIVAYDYTMVTENGEKISNSSNLLDVGFYEKKDIDGIKDRLVYDTDSSSHNTGCLIYSIWSKAIKRTLLTPFQLKVPNSIRNGEDLAVTIPAVCGANTMYVLRYAGYYYRRRESSMTHTFNPAETERICTLIHFMQENMLEIPQKNIKGYSVRILLGQIIKAARSFENYAEFRAYVANYCEEMLSESLQNYEQKNLKLSSKLRLWVMRRKMWYVVWAVYHKKSA